MSDHIPDATKMIGETPRTDQQNDDLLNSDSYTSWLEISGFARQLERELNAANERIKRLEEAWIPASTKPEGYERRVLLWVVWQGFGWRDQPEAKIGWWKHGPGCFAFNEFENADHLVTHWMEIADPTKAKEAKP